jgi:hypothetical protein
VLIEFVEPMRLIQWGGICDAGQIRWDNWVRSNRGTVGA